MKKLQIILTLITVLSGCNQQKLEGTFVYTEPLNAKNTAKGLAVYAEMGRDIACSSIGVVEFKNGKCYYSALLSHGSDVKVISPETLKNQIKEVLSAALDQYK